MGTDKQPIPHNQLKDHQPGYHVPVLLKESIDGLAIKADGIYVDCTFGGGGHSRAILEQLNEKGKLVAFDQDDDARKNLPQDERVIFVPQNFRHLQRFLRLHKITKVDGILADLGVSSHQFDEAGRGFSIRFDAALDMRMDQRQTITAADILKNFTELQLHKMLEQYGEVTNAKTLAKIIVQQRALTTIKTINEFKQAVQSAVKGNPQKYFAQVFQALRIEVNDELGALKELLQQTPTLLKPGGRIAIITFHSLEDRIVKNFFKAGTIADTEIDDIYGGRPENPFNIITKKPILPGLAEMKQNKRSRSAQLRVAEKK
jgi:16S rRNA (cytosine1402-N4)-methyltransferase